VATIRTSSQDDISKTPNHVTEVEDVRRRTFSSEPPQDPLVSAAFDIPEYMNPPQAFTIYDHFVRVWRSAAIELTPEDWRRCIGLLEFTQLTGEKPKTLGHAWWYDRPRIPRLAGHPYMLYTWYPGPQPCIDLVDVYRCTTLEIRWVIISLQGRDAVMKYRLLHKNNSTKHSLVTTEGPT